MSSDSLLGAPLTNPDGSRVTKRRKRKLFYIPGVGAESKGIPKYLALVFGKTIVEMVIKAYMFIAENYRRGDTVCIFGYSRGAFVARKVAGLLHRCLGVWDTVGAIYSSPECEEKDLLGIPDAEGFMDISDNEKIKYPFLADLEPSDAYNDSPAWKRAVDKFETRLESKALQPTAKVHQTLRDIKQAVNHASHNGHRQLTFHDLFALRWNIQTGLVLCNKLEVLKQALTAVRRVT
ncbi:hypothetical protein FRC11_014229 [Ceratobasidium sp. 423]|nr:hypothetical protein FRC11_014229 [Ceratobasidium sp. 423]